MFTGIVERLGRVTASEPNQEGRRLAVEAGELASGVEPGDSIAVNGTCLTVVDISDGTATFDVVAETLSRTNLGRVTAGDRVNLERSMAASGRFDGHIVQGHIDGIGTVRAIDRLGEGTRLSVEAPASLMRYVVEKGSITVDGVSLTVAALDDHGFEVALIPHTLETTTLGAVNSGNAVNLEVDVLAKYVERLLQATP